MGTSNFSDYFKPNAVYQITVRGYPVREVSTHLGVSTYSLYKWLKLYGASAAKQNAVDHEAEKRRLKRDVAWVTEVGDILKKGEACPPLVRGQCRARTSRESSGEVRLRSGASRGVRRPGDVLDAEGPAQRVLRLAERADMRAGQGRCPADYVDPRGLVGQRQGLRLPQAARRSAGPR